MSKKAENESQDLTTLEQAEKLVKAGLLERKEKDLAKSGGKTLLDKYADLFKVVEEQQFTTKILQKGEIVIGTILEARLTNSVLYPENYQMLIKALNVYKINPFDNALALADNEMVIEERREILYIAKAGCTQILRQLKIPEDEKGYNLKKLSENKTALSKLKGRRYSVKYMGVQEYNGHNFHSYVVNLL